MDERLEPYEDYLKNVVKPKVLRGEDILDSKWRRLVLTAYREIIKEQQDKIDKANEYINSTDFIYDEQYKRKDKLENILNRGDE